MKIDKFNIKFLLVIAFILPFNICFAGQFDEYKNELHSNRLALKDNAIWIAASKGLVKYDKTLGTVSSASEELGVNSDIEYLSIATAPDNSLWFASEEEGIKKYDEALYSYRASYYLNNNVIIGLLYSFAFDSSDRVFAGDLDNLFYVDNLTPKYQDYYCKQMYHLTMGKTPISPGRPLIDMAFDSNDNLWILSNNKNAQYSDGEDGLATLVKKDKDELDELLKEENIYPSISLSTTPILQFEKMDATSIVVDNDDNIWFTSNYGIHYYNQSTGVDSLMNSTTHSSIPNEHFYIAEKDSDGNIWFSSSTTLMKYNGEKFITYTCSNYKEARSILRDGNTVWILLKNDKLLRYQNRSFKVIDLTPAITGVKENFAETPKAKAYVSNGVLYIESKEDITSVAIYDAMGREILTLNPSTVERGVEITLPNVKGVLIVKVNNEVIKVVCNN